MCVVPNIICILDIGIQRVVWSTNAREGKVEVVVEHSIAFLSQGEGKQANELLGKRKDCVVIYGLEELRLILWSDILKHDLLWGGPLHSQLLHTFCSWCIISRPVATTCQRLV